MGIRVSDAVSVVEVRVEADARSGGRIPQVWELIRQNLRMGIRLTRTGAWHKQFVDAVDVDVDVVTTVVGHDEEELLIWRKEHRSRCAILHVREDPTNVLGRVDGKTVG